MNRRAGPRGSTPSAQLPRLGFTDTPRAAAQLAGLGVPPGDPVVDALADTADPDLALAALVRLADAAADRTRLLEGLRTAPELRRRLCAVLGSSAALGEHLARHPQSWHVLAEADGPAPPPEAELCAAVGAPDPDGVAADGGPAGHDALRVAYRHRLLAVAARDLCAGAPVDVVAAELAELARAVLVAALCIARAGLASSTDPTRCRLAVIGMGKCGGRELNYASDVDVLFVAEPSEPGGEEDALRVATALGTRLMRACSTVTGEGAIWPVDAALRPEGRSGPLVRTLASYQAYYRRWAQTWEFQALLKAAPVAGDRQLGERFVATLRPAVWSVADRPGFVEDVQAMRRRVEQTLPRAEAARELKLGPGGLRDVEFAVQLLQLVHGRTDDSLRSPNTLEALDALAAGGYVGRQDAAQLGDAYRFLRTVEHRLQLQRLRRTHLLPAEPAALRWLARALGYRHDPVAELERDHAGHARQVRRLHEKLFYRPLLSAVAALPADEVRLTPEAAGARLQALGFADPAAALRHLRLLTTGVSRRAAIQRTLLPVLLGWFADSPDPDGGLLAFRQVSEALGRTPWYLRLLRDEGVAAERLSRLLGTSRYVSDLLLRAPDAVALLADDAELSPRGRDALEEEFLAAAGRNTDSEAAAGAVRSLRRRELLRISCADLLDRLDVTASAHALSDVTAASLAAALQTATGSVEAELGSSLPVALSVVAMGRLGGGEQGYGSDADVLFVYEPLDGTDRPECTKLAHDVAEELRRLLTLPFPDPPLRVDADLRPEGRQGPLVRSLGSYAEYYRRWASLWEAQALLRARPVAGDQQLGERFAALVEAVRYPPDGLSAAQVREIRRVKARVETERLPRGADPALHLKLGRGGLADVEWTVQLLQLRHAGARPQLRTTGTLPALDAAAAAGLLDTGDAETLAAAWTFATRVRNALMLVRGRPADSVPHDVRTVRAVAHVLGYRPGEAGRLEEDYRRMARRARAVVERVFYA